MKTTLYEQRTVASLPARHQTVHSAAITGIPYEHGFLVSPPAVHTSNVGRKVRKNNAAE